MGRPELSSGPAPDAPEHLDPFYKHRNREGMRDRGVFYDQMDPFASWRPRLDDDLSGVYIQRHYDAKDPFAAWRGRETIPLSLEPHDYQYHRPLSQDLASNSRFGPWTGSPAHSVPGTQTLNVND